MAENISSQHYCTCFAKSKGEAVRKLTQSRYYEDVVNDLLSRAAKDMKKFIKQSQPNMELVKEIEKYLEGA